MYIIRHFPFSVTSNRSPENAVSGVGVEGSDAKPPHGHPFGFWCFARLQHRGVGRRAEKVPRLGRCSADPGPSCRLCARVAAQEAGPHRRRPPARPSARPQRGAWARLGRASSPLAASGPGLTPQCGRRMPFGLVTRLDFSNTNGRHSTLEKKKSYIPM